MKEKIYQEVLKEKEEALNKLIEEEKARDALEKYQLMLDLGLYETVPVYNEELFDYRNSFTGNDGQRYKLVPLDLTDEEILKVKAIDDEIKALKQKKRLKNDTFVTKLMRIASISIIALSILLSMVLVASNEALTAGIFFLISMTLNLLLLLESERMRLNQKKSD